MELEQLEEELETAKAEYLALNKERVALYARIGAINTRVRELDGNYGLIKYLERKLARSALLTQFNSLMPVVYRETARPTNTYRVVKVTPKRIYLISESLSNLFVSISDIRNYENVDVDKTLEAFKAFNSK